MAFSTRATRSRFSSPAHQGVATLGASSPLEASRSSGNDTSRSFMQRWLEPSIQNRASYEEAGLMRSGVLEGMAPLGVPPKPKKLEIGNGNGNGNGTGSAHGVRRVILRTGGASKDRNGASSGTESNGDKSTATALSGSVVAGTKRAASPGSRPTAVSSRRSLPVKSVSKKNDDDDDDYNPGGNRRKKSARRSQAPSSKTQEIRDAEAGQAAPALLPDETGLKLYPTAWALRTLYDEKSEDAEFDSMVTDVLQQTADDDTLDEFSKHIGEKKREGRTDNGDCYYFAPPSTATNRRIEAQKASKPTDAHHGELVGDSEDEEEIEEPEELHSPAADAEAGGVEEADESEKRAAKKAKTSHPSSASSTGRRLGLGDEDEGERSHGQQSAAAATTTATTTTTATATEAADGDADTPLRKRRRRNSGSSDSSLSSAMTLPSPEMRNKVGAATIGATGGGGGGGGSRGATSGTATGTATGASTSTSTSKPRSQKLSKPKQVQSKLTSSTITPTSVRDQFSLRPVNTARPRPSTIAALQPFESITASSQPNSPPASPTAHVHSSRTRQASMPGRLAACSNSSPHPPKAKTKSRAPAADSDAPMQQNQAAVQRDGSNEDLDAVWTRRRDAQHVTNNYTAAESAVRGSSQQRDTTPVSKTTRSRRSLANPPPTTRTTRSATKRPNDQPDETVSPIPLSLTGDETSTVGGSRAVTPTAQRQAKRPKGLRVKSSPVKKSGGPAGGLPRLASESQSSFRAGTPKDPATDNDEFCSACGNAGDVLCCDGCPRSFHFECVNLAQSEDLPDDWYCNECLVRRFPSRVPIHKGAFASALNNLEKSIPRAFSLPKRIQNRFEGVKAGPDGDYEEVASKTAKPRRHHRRRTGYDEMPDLFKQRDENQPVLCHACQKSSNDVRAIIPCSVCPFYWHLDCLDPPLAVPPVLKTWRCPTHVDDVLADAPRLAPAHKFRKVKNAQPITPIFTRGIKNNGHIDIDWSDEPELLKDAGWPDPLSFGRTYKVSAQGVILDFIEQLHKQGAGYGARQHEQKWVPYPSPAPQQGDNPSGPLLGSTLGRTVDEMQASLNLIGLRQRPSDGIDQLTSALLSSADENMLHLMARGNADNFALGQLTDSDKLSLRAMLAQMDAMSSRIRQVLGDTKPPPQQHISSMPTPDHTAAATPPAPPPDHNHAMAPRSSSPIAPKEEEDTAMTTMAMLSEPTPPLTVEGNMDLD
ncbi:hypothetical protein MY3296_002934 [Beauveria thailandica]